MQNTQLTPATFHAYFRLVYGLTKAGLVKQTNRYILSLIVDSAARAIFARYRDLAGKKLFTTPRFFSFMVVTAM